MGKMEQGMQKEMRRTKFNKAIISALAVSGTLAVALVAPNVLGAFGKMKFMNQRRFQVKTAFSRMVENGYISLEKQNGVAYARLTSKGEAFAALFHSGALAPQTPKRWDGKWRILTFDISEKRKNLRSKVRLSLSAIGFVRLQDSVWVYPYDCEDLIVLLKADFKVGKEMLYVIADRIENDGALRKTFNLS